MKKRKLFFVVLILLFNTITTKAQDQYVEWFNKGYDFFSQGDLESAKSNLLEAIRLKPDLANAYHLLGMIAYSQSDFKKSGDYFNSCIQYDPTNIYAYMSLVTLNIENFADTAKAGEMAIKLAENVSLDDPRDVNVADSTLTYQWAYYPAVEKLRLRIFNAKPNILNTMNLITCYREMTGNYDKAIEYSLYLIQHLTDNPASYMQAMMSYNKKQEWDKAIEYGLKGLNYMSRWKKNDNKFYFEYYYELAAAYSIKENVKESLKYFEEALTTNYINATKFASSDWMNKVLDDSRLEAIKETPEYKTLWNKYVMTPL